MAHATPRVEHSQLILPYPTTQPIEVDTAAWYDWLKQATSFAYTSAAGRFTARKEQRGGTDGFWRAYRRIKGQLHSAYLGKTAYLSLERLQRVAAELDEARTVPFDTLRAPATERSINLAPTPQAAVQAAQPRLPHGTVTFLLCSLDNSARSAANDASALHAVEQAIAGEDGTVFYQAGVDLAIAFASPINAVHAALSIAQTVNQADGIGMHTGVTSPVGALYQGHAIQFAQHLLQANRGAHVLVSQVTAELVRAQLPAHMQLLNLGSYTFGGTSRPERVYQLSQLGSLVPPAVLRPPARRPHNLPRPSTPLIGREMDIAAVLASLQQPNVRLLTLTGPGGVGKTRLAIAVATNLQEHFADGVFFVDLSAFYTPSLVLQQVARTLGVANEEPQAILTRLSDYLAARNVLLLLDNVEQVRSIAPMLVELLEAAPQLKVLATSRSILRLAGEHEYPVAPLAMPRTGAIGTLDGLGSYGAVRLFVERAQAVRPDFVLTAENAAPLAAICQRLDGLPLAIELAAVRLRLFSPEALLQRIERPLSILTGGTHDLPVRQQTLRATLDWSYRLLDPPAQTLLRRLAVFAGGFTLEAAEAVCSGDTDDQNTVVDALAELIDQSLLKSVPTTKGETRFTMLETLHEYAVEQLERTDEVPALRERHAHYFCELAEQAVHVPNQEIDRAWLDQLEAEHTNSSAALHWLVEQQQWETAARFAAALAAFWDLRSGRHEGYSWFATILAHTDALSLATCARTQHAAAFLARAVHNQPSAEALFSAAIASYRLLNDQAGLARALQEYAWAHIEFGIEWEQADALLDESLAIARTINDTVTLGWALQCRAWIAQFRALGFQHSGAFGSQTFGWVERFPGSLTNARALHTESLHLRRATGNPHATAWALVGLGIVAAAERDIEAARISQEERLEIERSLGNRYGLAETLRVLGALALRQGNYSTARTWLIEGLALAREVGERYTALFSITTLGEVALAEHEYLRAAALLDEALAEFTGLQDTRRIARISALRAQVALAVGNKTQAHRLALQCLEYAETTADRPLASFCLAAIADSAASVGNAQWAAQLWGAAEALLELPTVRHVPIEPHTRAQVQAEVCHKLGERTFKAVWASGRALQPKAVLELPRIAETPPAQQTYGLTPREIEVLRLLSHGHSNSEIANRLVISLETVKTYLKLIYRKISVSSRTAAVRFALDHGL